MNEEVIEAGVLVAEALDALRIPYVVGGSLASAAFGEPRFTRDVDIAAAIQPVHVGPLAAQLDPSFWAQRDLMEECVRERRMFNVLQRKTFIKVDLYPIELRGFAKSTVERALETIVLRDPVRRLRMSAAEDIVVQKLRWYRSGNEVSGQQWRDVLGVLKSQRNRIDVLYMQRWAEELGVLDLLARALVESGVDPAGQPPPV